MRDIINLYGSCTIAPLLLLGLYWAFWPGLMFVVTRTFEHRKVWLGKGQSRMFFPGDFMLGVAVISFVGMHYKNPVWDMVYSDKYWKVTAAIFFVLAMIIRTIDTKRYPVRSKYSPSKIAHDVCGYFVSFWLIAALGLPEIIWTIQHPECFEAAKTNWMIFFVAAAFFVAMTVWDVTHPATFDDLMKMHPQDWGRKKTEA